MSSQDDFLDELLKDNGIADIEGLDDFGKDFFLDVEDTQAMSETDIDKLLSEQQEAAQKHNELQQAGTSEAVDADIMALLQGAEDEVEMLDSAMLTEEDEGVKAAETTADITEEKKSKEKRRAEKAAAREAKKAEKAAKKQAKKEKKRPQLQESADKEAVNEEQDEISEKDFSDLDELLSLAANTVQTTGEKNVLDVDRASVMEKMVSEQRAADRAKKKNIFARFVDFLMEEDEEEENEKGNEDIKLSDENKTVIDELDKKKKKKDKKGKKSDVKNARAVDEDGEEASEEAENQTKSKKQKKLKKEKELTQEMLDEQERENKTKIPMKKVFPIAMVCVSFAVFVILMSGLSGDYTSKKVGREAFKREDYQECYKNLYGKELNENEQVMYSKSESIMRICIWIREYEMYVEEGAEAKALDSLIQSVSDYPTLYEYANQWNAGTEVAELYAQILDALSANYHLTEAQALEIAQTADNFQYSKMVYAIVDGEGFGSWKQSDEKNTESVDLKDILPEEEELEDVSFVDNNNE